MRVIEELHRVSVAFVNACRHYSDEKHKADPPPYESEEKLQARLEAQALIDQQILEERRAYLMKHKR